jgi:hypothetical protein
MTKRTCLWISLLFLSFSLSAYADSLISEWPSWEWDGNARAAYNSLNKEFLVVWNVFNLNYPTTDPNFFGALRGQRIKENGQKISGYFEIIPQGGVLADVVYNPQRNEYFVVAEQWGSTVGQRIGATGNKIGGQNLLMTYSRFPRVAYNSLLGNYLVVGGWLAAANDPNNSNSCNLYIWSVQVTADGYPGAPKKNVYNTQQACDAGDKFAVAFAPLAAADPVTGKNPTPNGRYLLAVQTGPFDAHILDASGAMIPVVYSPYYNNFVDNRIPYQSGSTQPAYSVDVAFGYKAGQPMFYLVWSEAYPGTTYFGHQWIGVAGTTISAKRTCFNSTETVLQGWHPISWLAMAGTHHASNAKDWKPRVAYNPVLGTFVIAWRETPDPNPYDSSVNHIRFNTSEGGIPPATNTVLSDQITQANPGVPFIATSTTSSQTLVGWSDFRWYFSRTFGVQVNASTRQVTNF